MVAVFRQLGDVARDAGTLVGLETGYPSRYGEFLQLIRDVDHPAVGATVDIGHVAFLEESGPRGTAEGVRNYNRNLVALCRDLGERLVHLHVHDVRKVDWRDHRTLGTGVIDLPALFTALRGVGYDGLLQLELEEPDQEPALVASKRQLERLIAAG
jgi:sugar phosphate isomerase/epimerase